MTQEHRLAEVRSFFEHGDHHLGYRRLLDAAIETADFDVYRHTLRFCDEWDAASGAQHPIAMEPIAALLERIGNRLPQAAPEASVLLQATGVRKRYGKGNFQLAPVDISIRAGQVCGLVGENGNGKTTLLRLLYGELAPDGGTISYSWGDPARDAYAVRTGIAFIPQRPKSWYGSLMSNLEFAAAFAGYKGEQNRLRTEMIVARMGLRPFRSYDWSRISSGYKMRFELARVLLCRPKVLLLDEPLANLDILAQQIILEDLKFLAASATMPLGVLLSSQQLYEVEKVSDEVLFLRQGVPQYRAHSAEGLVLELETGADRDALLTLLQPAGLTRISYNGGVHILYFNADAALPQVLELLGRSGLPVQYLRDISQSSRRFFVA